MAKDSTNKIPLAVIILNFQNYNFDFLKTDEVVFFDWLVVKGKSFGFKEFYHSAKQIHDQIGIGKNRLPSIQAKFVDLGIITLHTKPPLGGFGNFTHYQVDYGRIVELLPKIYKFTELSKPLPDFSKPLPELSKFFADLRQQQNTYQNNNRLLTETKEKKRHETEDFVFSFNGGKVVHQSEVTALISDLSSTFTQRKANSMEKGRSARTNYTFSPSIHLRRRIAESLSLYPSGAILDAFAAFCDSVLKREVDIRKNLLQYFFAKDGSGSFDVIETYNSKFALNYYISTSKK